MSANRACTASFVALRTLVVTKVGSGGGIVTSAPAGIDCGADCSGTFDDGTTVTLTAAPAGGSVFAGWSDGCTGTGACEPVMDADRSVTASFSVALSIDDVTVAEGNAGAIPATFTVVLSAPSSQSVTVHYATADGEAIAPDDYTAASGDLTFDAGVVSRQVAVLVEGDLLDEIDEHFTVQLSSAAGALIVRGAGTATIIDEDSRNELTHGSDEWQSLAAAGGVARVAYYRIAQQPRSSYEVLVEGASGDVQPVQLERLDADNATVLAPAARAVGSGAAVSLRWRNTATNVITTQPVRVRSGGSCSADCGGDDTYRVRAYETTCTISRFNNSGTQSAVLILQNRADDTITGSAYFWDGAGTLLTNSEFELGARQTLVLNTSILPALSAKSGSISIAHDGRYGDLVGKSVGLEPATGFSFDSPMEVRPH